MNAAMCNKCLRKDLSALVALKERQAARIAELEGALRKAENAMDHAINENACPSNEHHNNLFQAWECARAALRSDAGGGDNG
jgi:hypothetical protein